MPGRALARLVQRGRLTRALRDARKQAKTAVLGGAPVLTAGCEVVVSAASGEESDRRYGVAGRGRVAARDEVVLVKALKASDVEVVIGKIAAQLLTTGRAPPHPPSLTATLTAIPAAYAAPPGPLGSPSAALTAAHQTMHFTARRR